MPIIYPDPFLEVRICCIDKTPPHKTLCTGYEGGSWRSKALANHLFQWIPFVALSQESQLSLGSHNFLELLQVASAHIYKTQKTKSRGELGEILLHLACILNFETLPVICKLILKTSSNDTVKGFDGVHVVVRDDKCELWLGESKFYTDPKEAIREAIKSIRDHIAPSFLSTEKAMLIGHVGDEIPKRNEIVRLFKQQTSGDELINIAVFPVLIAYESTTVTSFQKITEEYVDSLREEVESLRGFFVERIDDLPLKFQLIFVPIESKKDVIDNFDKKLEAFL